MLFSKIDMYKTALACVKRWIINGCDENSKKRLVGIIDMALSDRRVLADYDKNSLIKLVDDIIERIRS